MSDSTTWDGRSRNSQRAGRGSYLRRSARLTSRHDLAGRHHAHRASVAVRRRLGVALIGCVAVFGYAVPAQADRVGQAPVRAPRVLQTIHTEFGLLGPWGQVRSAHSSGAYARDVPLPSGRRCRVAVSVRSTAAKVIGKPEKRIIRVLPGELLRFDHHGRHGSVRWWSGRDREGDLAAVAVQRAPKAVRSARRRWIVHRIDISFNNRGVDETTCSSLQHLAFGPKVVRRIARTIRLADGPAQAPQPPFIEPTDVG